MKSKIHIRLWLFIIALTSVYSGCPPTVKNAYNVTARFQRKTNPANTDAPLTLSFADTAAFSVRTDRLTGRISDIDVTYNKISGTIPPLTAVISMSYMRTLTDILRTGNGAAGNTGWLSAHVGELAVCTETLWLEHAPNEFGYNNTDSAISLSPVDELGAALHPVYREFGASYAAKFTDGDQYIPWTHPDVPNRAITLTDVTGPTKHLDMRSISRLLFGTFSATVTASVAGMPTFNLNAPAGISIPLLRASLGGPGRNGDFKLHFVPQLQANESGNIGDNNNQVLRGPGIEYYFEATLDARDALTGLISFATIKIIIPAILTFQRTDNSGDFQVELQPIADLSRGLTGGNATGMDKIIVLCSTPLGIQSQNTANLIRTSISTSLTATAAGPGGLGVFISSTIAFSSGFNKYKKNKQLAAIDFDVITIPNNCMNEQSPLCFKYNGIVSTQVEPETAGSTAISVFILNRFK